MGKAPHMRAMIEQSVSFECLDNRLVKPGQFDEIVDVGQDLRDVALERCLQLQQVAHRVGSGVAGLKPLPVSPILESPRDAPVNSGLGRGLPFTRAKTRSQARD